MVRFARFPMQHTILRVQCNGHDGSQGKYCSNCLQSRLKYSHSILMMNSKPYCHISELL